MKDTPIEIYKGYFIRRAVPEEIWFGVGTTTVTSRFYNVLLAVAPFQAEPYNACVIQYLTSENSSVQLGTEQHLDY